MASAQAVAFEQAKAYLMKTDKNGNSVYDILVQLMTYIEENKIAGDVDFDKLLQMMKEDSLKASHQVVHAELEIDPPIFPEFAILQKQAPSQPQFNSGTRVNTYFEGITDIIEQSRILKSAGVGLSDEEIFHLAFSVKQLTSQNPLKKLRFFGKITTLSSPYYIFESDHINSPASRPPVENVPNDLPPEEPNVGSNKWNYWVSNNLPEGKWTLLPDVIPYHVNIARRIQKFFTGDLEMDMKTYPDFKGKEKHYLRAQISRIAAGTILAPKGLLAAPEAEAEEDPENPKPKVEKPELTFAAEGFEGFPPKQLANLENWVHVFHHLMLSGRCTVYKPPKQKKAEGEEEQEEAEEDNQEDNPKDPKIPFLRQINEDNPIILPEGRPKRIKKVANAEGDGDAPQDGGDAGDGEAKPLNFQEKQPSWIAKLINSTIDENNYGFVALRSKRWPGAFTYGLMNGKMCGGVYFGNGLKYFPSGTFTPYFPPLIEKDLVEVPEQIDATVENEKRVKQGLKPITGDEKPEGEEENKD